MGEGVQSRDLERGGRALMNIQELRLEIGKCTFFPPSRVARELCLLSHWPRRPNCAAHALGSRWHSQCPVPNHYIISRGEVDRSPLMHYPSAPWCRPGQRGDAELSIKRTDDLWKVEVRCATTRWDDSVRGGMSKR